MEILTTNHKNLSVPALTAHIQYGRTELLEMLRNDWQQLTNQGNVPYNRPEFFSDYISAFEPGERIVIVTVTAEDNVVAILPLVETLEIWYGFRVRVLTTPRDDHYPWFDIICETGIEEDKICNAILQELVQLGSWDVLRLRRVAEESAAYRFLGAAKSTNVRAHSIKVTMVPYIKIDPARENYDAFLGTRSGKFRYMLRRATRKAAESGGISLRCFENFEASALQEFYRVEASGWKGKSATAILSEPHVLRFYNQSAKTAADKGYFRLYLLELNSRAIAGMFAFQFNKKFHLLKIGYDEAYKQLAPGHLLVNAVLRECWQTGVGEFDFLGGFMPWKRDWTSQFRPCWNIHFYRNNFKGWLLEKFRYTIIPIARNVYRRFGSKTPPQDS